MALHELGPLGVATWACPILETSLKFYSYSCGSWWEAEFLFAFHRVITASLPALIRETHLPIQWDHN